MDSRPKGKAAETTEIVGKNNHTWVTVILNSFLESDMETHILYSQHTEKKLEIGLSSTLVMLRG